MFVITWIGITCLTSSRSECYGQNAVPTSTAQEIVGRIKGNLGVEWQDGGMDGYRAGKPTSKVTGVTVTLFPTYRVLKQAAESGNNMVICHEPLFYSGCADEDAENDQVLIAKRKLIQDNGLVVFRFHDNIHRMKPDGIHRGMIRQLQWAKYLDDENDNNEIFNFPERNLADFAKEIRKSLSCNTIRVVGDPEMKFSKVALSAGAWMSKKHIKLLRRDDVEVLVIGESREWQTFEYVRDAIDSGQKKALIVLGHTISEEAGMEWCTKWMETFVTKLPVEHVPSEEPYWSPVSK